MVGAGSSAYLVLHFSDNGVTLFNDTVMTTLITANVSVLVWVASTLLNVNNRLIRVETRMGLKGKD